MRARKSGEHINDVEFVPSGPFQDPLVACAHPNAVKGEHRLQLYESDAVLVKTVAAFLRGAIQENEVAVCIATPNHLEQIEAALVAEGHDVLESANRGKYVARDAAKTLAEFMVDGLPDKALFNASVGAIVREAAKKSPRPRAFGEMVALLWAVGNAPAAFCGRTPARCPYVFPPITTSSRPLGDVWAMPSFQLHH